jgi:hypothetical protein
VKSWEKCKDKNEATNRYTYYNYVASLIFY